ncbi:hypothetical protein [Actinoplanes sp. NPDC051859]|uniref:hypothetical protein n=1 Tax=Actinoplanes sp. NPDC051859 TaxID=3363909 RepID=UPI00379D75E8
MTSARAGAAEACPSGAVADQTPAAETEKAAQRLAQLCDKPVEVLSAADEFTKVTALPSGTFTFESSIEPERVERSGQWLDVDTNLEPGADGRLHPRAAADVTFSRGGDGPFVVLRGGGADFSLSWSGTLPPGEVSEDRVTYKNVYPDVDLVARALPGGFSHVLVVRTAEAASLPASRAGG